MNTTQKLSFSSSKIDTLLSDSTRGNFTSICQIKWNWIRSMKFEPVRIHFLSEVFAMLSSKNFAIMATWCNDFSSLLISLMNNWWHKIITIWTWSTYRWTQLPQDLIHAIFVIILWHIACHQDHVITGGCYAFENRLGAAVNAFFYPNNHNENSVILEQ